MNILVTVPNYFPHSFGGIQTYVYCLAKGLLKRGHKVVILTTMPWQKNNKRFAIRKYLFEDLNVITFSIDPAGSDAREQYTGPGSLARQVLGDILTEVRPDLVHINDMEPSFTSLCNEMRIPHVVTAHRAGLACPAFEALLRADSSVCEKSMDPQDCIVCCSDLLRQSRWYTGGLPAKIPSFIYRWYGEKLAGKRNLSYLGRGLIYPWLIEQDILEKKNFLDHVQCIIAPSLYMKNLLVRNGCDSRRIVIIPHGISPLNKNLLRYRGKSPVRFGYIGRIKKSKGLHILLQSAELLPDGASCEVHIFGAARNTTDEKYSRKISSEYKGRVPIIKHGLIPHDKLYEAFAIIDVLVVPSVVPEAFGLVVQEAFSAGRPVIVAKSGGIAGLVRDGIDGLVVERNDPRALSRALQKIIDSPGLIQEMAGQAPYIKTDAEYAAEVDDLYHRMVDPGIGVKDNMA